MMKKSLLAIAALALLISPAIAQVSNGKVTTADPTYANNTIQPLSITTIGRLRVDALISSSSGTMQVVGNVASGVADAGNPVKAGGVYSATLPVLSNGQRGDLQVDVNGNLRVGLIGSPGIGSDGTNNTALVSVYATNSQSSGVRPLNIAPYVFNGTTWDRDFTCNQSAIIDIAAGAIGQLVALSGSTIIRVCNFTITSGVGGTAQFQYGTGATCATGLTALTAAMVVAASGQITATGMNGSLFRTPAGNALCLTAVTGAAKGFLTYAQF